MMAFLTQACQEFLEAKPEKKLAILTSTGDAQVLLNNTTVFNLGHPSEGVISSDDLYVTYDDWMASRTLTEKNAYVWDANVFNDNYRNSWSLPYTTVYNSNIVLDAVENNELSFNHTQELNDIKGQALFFRAYSFFNLLQLFAEPWSVDGENDKGIVLRLTSDFNIPSVRATLKESYDQVIHDAEEAYSLLNETSEISSRPNKVAVLAFLARVYLSMEEYSRALNYVDRVLDLKNDLLDYNKADGSIANPFERFNQEVIFHAVLGAPLMLRPHITKVDTVLYRTYEENDLRKLLYFKDNDNGTYSFRGSYDGSDIFFSGLTVEEMYYIKAECMARIGRFDEALLILSDLLEKRWLKKDGLTTYEIPPFSDDNEILTYILNERRKGLLFRGTRWSDLRRLNKDPRFSKILKRKLGEEEFMLEPNHNRYVFPIPLEIIKMTGMEQNK